MTGNMNLPEPVYTYWSHSIYDFLYDDDITINGNPIDLNMIDWDFVRWEDNSTRKVVERIGSRQSGGSVLLKLLAIYYSRVCGLHISFETSNNGIHELLHDFEFIRIGGESMSSVEGSLYPKKFNFNNPKYSATGSITINHDDYYSSYDYVMLDSPMNVKARLKFISSCRQGKKIISNGGVADTIINLI